MLYKTKFYWGSGKDQQQHAHGVACPITNSKHSTLSDALTPVDCQGYLVSSSLGSKTKSCKCLLMRVRVVLSLGSTNRRGFERIVLYVNNVGSILLPMLVRGQGVCSLSVLLIRAKGRVSAVCLRCWYWWKGRVSEGYLTLEVEEGRGVMKGWMLGENWKFF